MGEEIYERKSERTGTCSASEAGKPRHSASPDTAERNKAIGTPPTRPNQASGIFAGIDFNKFVKPRKKTPPPIVRERVAPTRPKSILDRSIRNVLGIKSIDEDMYGPALPPPAT